jgi:hypothetical protein
MEEIVWFGWRRAEARGGRGWKCRGGDGRRGDGREKIAAAAAAASASETTSVGDVAARRL